jgi:hypothetical protein
MLPRIGTPSLERTDATLLIAHQKWSTCRIPALNAAAISGQLAFECPQVIKQRRFFASR